MKYCLDISPIVYGTGVSMYTANLGRALANKESNQLRFFGSSLRHLNQIKQFGIENRIKSYLYRFPPRISSRIWQSSLPIDPWCGFSDVFHTWDWYLPKGIKTHVVITIHDVAQFRYPDIAHPDIRAHHERVIKRVIAQKPHIIAVSHATKQDILELFPKIDSNLITVVHEALPRENCIRTSDEAFATIKKTLGIEKPYFLMVGTKEPRKNIPLQIQAWRKYKKDFDLVLVGKSGWETIKPEAGLIIAGYTSGPDLAALYQGASVLLYVSIAEGFGLPILEAFYHHTPVVTSNTSSLAEIGADAVVQVNPLDVVEIRNGIKKAIDNRNELTTKSVTRLADFSWEKAAAETLAVYQQAAQRSV